MVPSVRTFAVPANAGGIAMPPDPYRSKENVGILPAPLRNALRARGVSQIQVAYCAFKGIPFASLSVARFGSSKKRIYLPRYLRTALRRAFDCRMSLTYPTWLDGPDCAGIFRWDLRFNSGSHKHFGYRQQFFSAEQLLTDGTNYRTKKAFIP
jgi:hypothetical protein